MRRCRTLAPWPPAQRGLPHARPLGLAIVVGIHTFAGAVLEGLPVNHFLTILICCAAAVNVAQAKRTLLPIWPRSQYS